jgi:hypothetical protein
MPYRLFYKEMWVYRALENWKGTEPIPLPHSRNLEKDTLEYLVYMHSRHEIIEDAISENPWDTTHFAWIDFNSPRLFSKKNESFSKLREIAKYPFPEETMYFAGCWPKLDAETAKNIANTIHWRFCGAFFLGDAKSFSEFADQYRAKFPEFLKLYGVFSWEVNFWAWMEWSCGAWKPTWYRGDHNDQMLNIFSGVSADTYAVRLPEDANICKLEYVYPDIDTFLPGSASYVEHEGKHYLNTRMVNYWMYPSGYYRFHTPDFVIENRNLFSELDADTLMPIDFREMEESVLYRPDGDVLKAPEREKRPFSVGLEDIRLFCGKRDADNKRPIRYLATNVEYSPVSKNRMVLGTYDSQSGTYRDCIVVIPPDPNSWCEKNWIPIVSEWNGGEEELFIYKWSPMEIGRVNPVTNQLQIVIRHEITHWLFSRLRGSTTFVDCPDTFLPEELRGGGDNTYLVGLVHFSEEHSPRHYYHLLVLLEKKTLRPVRYSKVFYFEKLTIEFCIGMAVREAQYVFWISRFDRDPICIKMDARALPLENVV